MAATGRLGWDVKTPEVSFFLFSPLTVWNPADFVGGSSECHILPELFGEAGTFEDFPVKAWAG